MDSLFFLVLSQPIIHDSHVVCFVFPLVTNMFYIASGELSHSE